MPSQSNPPLHNQSRPGTLIPLLNGVLTTSVTFTFGLLGLIKGWHFSQFPHLFFGLLTASAVSGLLTVPLAAKWLGKRRGNLTPNEEAKRPQFGVPPAQQSSGAVCASVGVVPPTGLSVSVAEARRREYGPNVVELDKGPGFWAFFFKEIYEPTQLLLLGVGVLYALFGGLSEAAAAFAVIALMVAAEVRTEWRAKRAVGALARSAPKSARVRRDGRVREVAQGEVVPGDVVLLKTGDEVPADLRLLDTLFLEIDESSLSGEPAAVPKDAAAVQPPGESPGLLDCPGMALAGTVVTRGKGTGVVVATGAASEMGGMMGLVKKAKEKKTPLQALLKQVAGTLSLVAIGLSAAAAAAGLLRGRPWQTALLTFLSLLFATIPEELPILIAATLAVSAQALSKHHIFVKKLRAAESLAYVDTIITDKTGTLTHNRLRLAAAWTPVDTWGHVSMTSAGEGASTGVAGPGLPNLLRAWLFMSEIGDAAGGRAPGFQEGLAAEARSDTSVSDAFDVAVLGALDYKNHSTAGNVRLVTDEVAKGLWEDKVTSRLTNETPFDSRAKMAARTFVQEDAEHSTVLLKGAPERILERCGVNAPPEAARRAAAEIERAAKAGLRLIGYASSAPGDNGPFDFLGFLAFEDPVREDAASAVALCEGAGIDVIVVSGDHVSTVAAAAGKVGIGVKRPGDVETGYGAAAIDCQRSSLGDLPGENIQALVADHRVFGRATPADKLALLTGLQERGHVVLATGDGTNDAPILATADVGLAMGRGTDVARAACSIVLMDDAFAGVTLALREGRRMFANLRKALAFYLGAKAGLLIIFAAGSLVSRFPLQPLHVIILELFMDLGASTAFVMEAADSDVMRRPPQKTRARFFDREMLTWIMTSAGCMASCVLVCYGYGLTRLDDLSAQTLAFYAWLLGHVLLALNMRTFTQPLAHKGLLTNPAMLVWSAAAAALVATCALLQPLADFLKLARLDVRSIGIVVGSALLLTCWIEVAKLVTWHRRRGHVGERGTLQEPLLQ